MPNVNYILSRKLYDLVTEQFHLNYYTPQDNIALGRNEKVKILLDQGASPDVPLYGDKMTAFQRAAEQGDEKFVSLFLTSKKGLVSKKDSQGHGALDLALYRRQFGIIELITEHLLQQNVNQQELDALNEFLKNNLLENNAESFLEHVAPVILSSSNSKKILKINGSL
ncbi:MAG: ankyrin repeat domain-containing protein [Gammaproteobacteria bacterium]|nr:ankyrin repeat domain-containing protein [Gammaproteobacteria bacterium]